jgi:hypothetical protein
MSGYLCEDGHDPLGIVVSPFKSQNFVAMTENGIGVSLYDDHPSLAEDTKYSLDLEIPADGDHLTFTTLPDDPAGYYACTLYGPGFDFKRVRISKLDNAT